ncbi:hypothetical protein FOZ63_029697, partial [Perkinsus olseni]
YIAKFRGQIHQFANYVLKNAAFSTLPEEIRETLSSSIHALERRVPFDLPYSGYLNNHPEPMQDVSTDDALNDVLDIYIPRQLHYTLPGEVNRSAINWESRLAILFLTGRKPSAVGLVLDSTP